MAAVVCGALMIGVAGLKAAVTIAELGESVTTDFTGYSGALPNGFTTTGVYISSSVGTTGGLYGVNGFNYQPSSNSSASSLKLTGEWG
ncbi:MAG: hypothetical protein ACAI34_15150, partial [Verrucomicrobium sp.]